MSELTEYERLCRVEAEIATLKQELQALRDQNPVAVILCDQGQISADDYVDFERVELIDHINSDDLIRFTDAGRLTNLYAAPMPAREGWKLVPIEPTEEMRLSGMTQLPLDSVIFTESVYKAMLEAAPKEPS